MYVKKNSIKHRRQKYRKTLKYGGGRYKKSKKRHLITSSKSIKYRKYRKYRKSKKRNYRRYKKTVKNKYRKYVQSGGAWNLKVKKIEITKFGDEQVVSIDIDTFCPKSTGCFGGTSAAKSKVIYSDFKESYMSTLEEKKGLFERAKNAAKNAAVTKASAVLDIKVNKPGEVDETEETHFKNLYIIPGETTNPFDRYKKETEKITETLQKNVASEITGQLGSGNIEDMVKLATSFAMKKGVEKVIEQFNTNHFTILISRKFLCNLYEKLADIKHNPANSAIRRKHLVTKSGDMVMQNNEKVFSGIDIYNYDTIIKEILVLLVSVKKIKTVEEALIVDRAKSRQPDTALATQPTGVSLDELVEAIYHKEFPPEDQKKYRRRVLIHKYNSKLELLKVDTKEISTQNPGFKIKCILCEKMVYNDKKGPCIFCPTHKADAVSVHKTPVKAFVKNLGFNNNSKTETISEILSSFKGGQNLVKIMEKPPDPHQNVVFHANDNTHDAQFPLMSLYPDTKKEERVTIRVPIPKISNATETTAWMKTKKIVKYTLQGSAWLLSVGGFIGLTIATMGVAIPVSTAILTGVASVASAEPARVAVSAVGSALSKSSIIVTTMDHLRKKKGKGDGSTPPEKTYAEVTFYSDNKPETKDLQDTTFYNLCFVESPASGGLKLVKEGNEYNKTSKYYTVQIMHEDFKDIKPSPSVIKKNNDMINNEEIKGQCVEVRLKDILIDDTIVFLKEITSKIASNTSDFSLSVSNMIAINNWIKARCQVQALSLVGDESKTKKQQENRELDIGMISFELNTNLITLENLLELCKQTSGLCGNNGAKKKLFEECYKFKLGDIDHESDDDHFTFNITANDGIAKPESPTLANKIYIMARLNRFLINLPRFKEELIDFKERNMSSNLVIRNSNHWLSSKTPNRSSMYLKTNADDESLEGIEGISQSGELVCSDLSKIWDIANMAPSYKGPIFTDTSDKEKKQIHTKSDYPIIVISERYDDIDLDEKQIMNLPDTTMLLTYLYNTRPQKKHLIRKTLYSNINNEAIYADPGVASSNSLDMTTVVGHIIGTFKLTQLSDDIFFTSTEDMLKFKLCIITQILDDYPVIEQFIITCSWVDGTIEIKHKNKHTPIQPLILIEKKVYTYENIIDILYITGIQSPVRGSDRIYIKKKVMPPYYTIASEYETCNFRVKYNTETIEYFILKKTDDDETLISFLKNMKTPSEQNRVNFIIEYVQPQKTQAELPETYVSWDDAQHALSASTQNASPYNELPVVPASPNNALPALPASANPGNFLAAATPADDVNVYASMDHGTGVGTDLSIPPANSHVGGARPEQTTLTLVILTEDNEGLERIEIEFTEGDGLYKLKTETNNASEGEGAPRPLLEKLEEEDDLDYIVKRFKHTPLPKIDKFLNTVDSFNIEAANKFKQKILWDGEKFKLKVKDVEKFELKVKDGNIPRYEPLLSSLPSSINHLKNNPGYIGVQLK